jgi:hypothetical protein
MKGAIGSLVRVLNKKGDLEKGVTGMVSMVTKEETETRGGLVRRHGSLGGETDGDAEGGCLGGESRGGTE